MSTLIERIDERLRELDMSERRAQQLAGLSTSWIHDLRRGQKRDPSYVALRKLADALRCDVVWLAEGRGDKFAGAARDTTSAAILDQLEQYDEADRQAMLRILKGGGFRDTG